MKKSALLSAIALTSAFGLASCSSTEDDGNINPTFDGQSVKTQFAINIPRAAGNNGTRATAEQTQGETSSKFLGIKNILLLPFSSAVTSPTQESLPIINTLEAIYPTDTDAPHKVYADVDIPTGTKNFLFYGYAMPPQNTSGDYITNPFITGAFQTEDFDQVGNNDDYKAEPKDVSFQLKPVLSSGIDYTATTPAALSLALNKVMAIRGLNDNTMVQLKTLHAGSLNSIKQILQRVYDQDVTGTTAEEGFKEAIASAFTITSTGVLETKEGIDEFPRNLNLPDGIAKINYTDDGTFSYQDKNIGMGNMKLDPTSITYPAPIVYWTNTDIRTKDSDESNWSSKFDSWTQDGNWTGWNNTNAGVSSSTIAVALKNQINYGVASLKLQVKCAENLADHNGEAVTIPSNGFKVTGLMIGNQPDGVDYKFETATGETFAKTIFDKFEDSNYLYAKKGEAQNTNYTIVLPSEKKSGTTKGVINFALELENDKTDFQGNDGIVPSNGKFYLIGKMDPEEGTIQNSIADPAVFMSDYQTTLTVTITSLANAYNCIPDIRNTQQQLGLSVNLEWEKGYNFNVNIGGDN